MHETFLVRKGYNFDRVAFKNPWIRSCQKHVSIELVLLEIAMVFLISELREHFCL